MAFRLKSQGSSFKQMGSSPAKNMKTGNYNQSFESPAKHKDKVNEGSNLDPKYADAHNKRHAEGGTHGEIGSKDNKWTENKQSPAKQRRGTEGQDQDKIFNDKGEHVGDYVNGKKVMHNDKMQKTLTNAQKTKAFGEMMKNTEWMPKPKPRPKKSPAKQTKDTFKDGSKKSARDKFNDKETAAEIKKNGGRDNQKPKTIVGEKTSGFGPVAKNNNLTPKQNAVSRAEMKGIDSKSPYWYKIDGKTVSKKQYLNYENKPGNMEGGGKQTNHPDVYGRKASNHGRGPKTK